MMHKIANENKQTTIDTITEHALLVFHYPNL